MPYTKTELKAVATAFNPLTAPTHDVVLRRDGNAYQRDVFLEGKARFKWKADGTSYPLPLPPGAYTLRMFIRGKKSSDTYAFGLVAPHAQPLGADKVGPLLADSYDRIINVP